MEQIIKIQQLMAKHNYNAYIVPTSDFHNSEYISPYFQGRQYLSGFTGSAGTLLITKGETYLWTDGRYFIQAEKQLEGSGIILMKMGEPKVQTIGEFLNDYLSNGDFLAFDGKVMTTYDVLSLKKEIKANIQIISDVDLVNEIWPDRPSLPFSVLYKLDTFFSGKSYKDKLKEIRTEMAKEHSDVHILTRLEDQAWLYNLRGNDVSHTPVFLAYTVITNDNVVLYIDQSKIDLAIEKYLDENDIIVKPYNEIYSAISHIKDKTILIDYKNVNYQIYNLILEGNHLIDSANPSLLLKSIKNETEIKNLKLAHIKDGVAMTKFLYFVKNNAKNNVEMSEMSVSDYLANLRKKQNGFVDLSFNTIAAYCDHGAMMHYSANEKTNYAIEDNGFLLVDSGGHYLEGTTDITRTIAIGEINDTMKTHFTTVLKSVIALSTVKFIKGCNGLNLDILARGPIWNLGIDYKCGTGHGVGYLLSVHEAPNGFRYKVVKERNDSAPFVPGMITTNEPGIYLEGKYGIRTENEMLCVEKEKTEFGEFYGFETITYAPIDIDAINPDMLNQEEKNWINNYHKNVYNTLVDKLSEDEQIWLKEYTREI